MTSRIRNAKGHPFLSALMVQRGCLVAQFDTQKHSKTWAQTRLSTDVCIANAWDTMVYIFIYGKHTYIELSDMIHDYMLGLSKYLNKIPLLKGLE